jgi:hypothetical protein
VLTILWAVIRPMFRKKDPLQRPPAYASLSRQRAVERDMQHVLVELSEMARQISGQLDTRAAKLEALIKEADEKIAVLKCAAPASPQTHMSPSLESDSQSVPPISNPRHDEVYALADAGRSPREISEDLNRPSGEIELILALRA